MCRSGELKWDSVPALSPLFQPKAFRWLQCEFHFGEISKTRTGPSGSVMFLVKRGKSREPLWRRRSEVSKLSTRVAASVALANRTIFHWMTEGGAESGG